MTRNNNFSGFFGPEKVKYYPEKNLPNFFKNIAKKQREMPLAKHVEILKPTFVIDGNFH